MIDKQIPKKIWICWFQGLEEAPTIVKYSYKTWVKNNPTWEVVLITDENISEYINEEELFADNLQRITLQKKANILRLNLLKQYGGVWVDASTICTVPLDEWIHDYMTAGFFVLRDPAPERLLATWFLAALPNNYLLTLVCDEHTAYWRDYKYHDTKTGIRKFIRKTVNSYTSKNVDRTYIWLHWFFQKFLKINPYFIFHYHFAYLIKKDKKAFELFNAIPYMPSLPSFIVARMFIEGSTVELVKKELEKQTSPIVVHKLSLTKKMRLPDRKVIKTPRKILRQIFD